MIFVMLHLLIIAFCLCVIAELVRLYIMVEKAKLILEDIKYQTIRYIVIEKKKWRHYGNS